MSERKRLAVVRVRGTVGVRHDVQLTLKLLRLNKPNHCVVIDDRSQYLGMLRKVKDYVTWGEVKGEVLEKLLEKRGRLEGNRKLSDAYLRETTRFSSIREFVQELMRSRAELKDIPKLKPVFRLKPPSKGYERRGVKEPFSIGGALGYRGERINDLLLRMI